MQSPTEIIQFCINLTNSYQNLVQQYSGSFQTFTIPADPTNSLISRCLTSRKVRKQSLTKAVGCPRLSRDDWELLHHIHKLQMEVEFVKYDHDHDILSSV